jgi:hypothetical protein
MQHDIYSIGVVLLEIGLWTSFVSYPRALSQETEFGVPAASQVITLLSSSEERDPRLRAFRDKEMLETLAKRELPPRLGRKYTDMVLLCLRCLDSPEFVGISSIVDNDGIGIGVSFVETVLELVHEISL